MGKLLNKKTLIIIGAILIIIGVIFLLWTILFKEKKEVNEIEVLSVLSSEDEVKAVALVEANTVKIINTLDDGNTIVGTGFFHETGYLLTNSHVVDIKGNIRVYYPDGESTDAELVSNDIISDVAILKVDNVRVKAMYFGDTISLEPPMNVISIGYAYNLEGEATVTKGAFSARRSMSGVEYLQSDAGLNYGNSGGPLIDSKGNLLGMNSYASENATINFSISAESLENIVIKLVNEKKVQYMNGERPENALSSILKSVGFSSEDIYEESKFLKNDEEDDNANSSEEEITNVNNEGVSRDNTVKNETSNNTNPPETTKAIYWTPKDNIDSLRKIEISPQLMSGKVELHILPEDRYGCQLIAAEPYLYGNLTVEVFKSKNIIQSNDELEVALAGTNPPTKIITKNYSYNEFIPELSSYLPSEVYQSILVDISISEISSYLQLEDRVVEPVFNQVFNYAFVIFKITLNTAQNGSYFGTALTQINIE